MGGFVRWYMGSEPNGADSIAKQIAPASHWPEMRILILVVCINFNSYLILRFILNVFMTRYSVPGK